VKRETDLSGLYYIPFRRELITLALTMLTFSSGFSQEAFWNARLFSFFDNTEFGRSELKIPQTMAGVLVVPELGLRRDTVHKLHFGASMLHEFGSVNVIDKVYPEAYYSYDRQPVRFLMGAFPREIALDNYPRLFFQDSLSYYRPMMNGMFVEYRRRGGYFNLWLDWTGRQSATVHEAFFIGMSGRYNLGIFNVKHFGYYYHFAAKLNPVIEEALHDNGLMLTSAGFDFGDRLLPFRLEADAGWVFGLERARADNTGWLTFSGIMMNTKAMFRFIGFKNSFYAGNGLMKFYTDHGSDLYWGDPVYRAKISDRADVLIDFMKNKNIDLELTYSFHFLEGRVYNEQMLKLKIDLGGNFRK
jgi:hypothetical protein